MGVLVVHGFTGTPGSMRDVAAALAAAGHTVELPLLPGHGTTVDDMIATGWDDWSAAAQSALDELSARVDHVVVLGLSMGGSLTLWLATKNPDLAGIVCVNPAVVPQGEATVTQLTEILASGMTVLPAIGSDIAMEGVVEVAYDSTPVGPLLSLQDGLRSFHDQLASIEVPLLLLTSPQDHVVTPTDSDYLAEVVSGPVTRVSLDRSFHVATQDYDQGLIISSTLTFITEVTS